MSTVETATTTLTEVLGDVSNTAPGPCACELKPNLDFETVHIEKGKGTCGLCADYARENPHKPM
jgi:hypothetical protein